MTAHRGIEYLQTAMMALSASSHYLEEEKEKARARYVDLEDKCQAVHLAIDALQREMDLLNDGSTGFDTSPAIDLSRCMNLEERLEQIAIANRGYLNLPHALEVIIAAGVSRASERTIRGEIRKVVTRNPQDWESVGDNLFRYIPHEDQGNEGP